MENPYRYLTIIYIRAPDIESHEDEVNVVIVSYLWDHSTPATGMHHNPHPPALCPTALLWGGEGCLRLPAMQHSSCTVHPSTTIKG